MQYNNIGYSSKNWYNTRTKFEIQRAKLRHGARAENLFGHENAFDGVLMTQKV